MRSHVSHVPRFTLHRGHHSVARSCGGAESSADLSSLSAVVAEHRPAGSARWLTYLVKLQRLARKQPGLMGVC